jgi:hypothetical protein
VSDFVSESRPASVWNAVRLQFGKSVRLHRNPQTSPASVAFTALEDRLPRLFDLLFALAAVANAAAYVFDLWDRIAPFDELIRVFTTFAVTSAFGYLLFMRSSASRDPFVLVAAVTLFGVAFGMIGDTVDTLVDLAMTASARSLPACSVHGQSRHGQSRSVPGARAGSLLLLLGAGLDAALVLPTSRVAPLLVVIVPLPHVSPAPAVSVLAEAALVVSAPPVAPLVIIAIALPHVSPAPAILVLGETTLIATRILRRNR